MAMTGYKDTMARVFLETALAEKHMGISVLYVIFTHLYFGCTHSALMVGVVGQRFDVGKYPPLPGYKKIG